MLLSASCRQLRLDACSCWNVGVLPQPVDHSLQTWFWLLTVLRMRAFVNYAIHSHNPLWPSSIIYQFPVLVFLWRFCLAWGSCRRRRGGDVGVGGLGRPDDWLISVIGHSSSVIYNRKWQRNVPNFLQWIIFYNSKNLRVLLYCKLDSSVRKSPRDLARSTLYRHVHCVSQTQQSALAVPELGKFQKDLQIKEQKHLNWNINLIPFEPPSNDESQ